MIFFRGDTWRALRKMLSPTFTTGKLKSMIDPIDEIADSLVADLKVKAKGNSELNMKPILQGFTMDAICKVAFSMATNCHKGEDQEIMKLAIDSLSGFIPKSYVEDFFFLLFFHLPELMPGGFWPESALKLSKISKDVMAQRDQNNIHIGYETPYQH